MTHSIITYEGLTSETSVYSTSPHGVQIYNDIYNCFLRNTDTVDTSYSTSLHLISLTYLTGHAPSVSPLVMAMQRNTFLPPMKVIHIVYEVLAGQPGGDPTGKPLTGELFFLVD